MWTTVLTIHCKVINAVRRFSLLTCVYLPFRFLPFDIPIWHSFFCCVAAEYNDNSNNNNKSNNETITEAISIRLLTLLVFISAAFCFAFLFCFAHFRFFCFHFVFSFFFCHMRHFLWSALRSRLALISEIKCQADNVNNLKCPACASVCVWSRACTSACTNACASVCVCVYECVCILWPPHYKRVYSSSHGADFRFPFPLARFSLSVPLSLSLSLGQTGSAASCWCRITVLRLIMQMP